jgi:hypothetical protein
MNTEKPSYKQLKRYFESNAAKIPLTLGCNYIVIHNVPEYIQAEIRIVDRILKEHGKNAVNFAQARAGVAGLFRVYVLMNTEGADKVKELKGNQFKNKKN